MVLLQQQGGSYKQDTPQEQLGMHIRLVGSISVILPANPFTQSMLLT